MLQKLTTALTLWLLNRVTLKGEYKAKITAKLLDNLQAVPISNILFIDKMGRLYIDGKLATQEQALSIKASGISFKDSFLEKLINDQITYQALQLGIHEGNTTDQIIFSKAALWVIQERKKLITQITE